jgi:hypothetical protein
MLTSLLEWMRQLFGGALPWVVVPPWCAGVRVRLGKRAVELRPGIHMRVPLLDSVQLVSTRARYVSGQPVTVSEGRRGYVRVRCAMVGFRIDRPIDAMLRYAHPEHVMQALATVAAGRFDESKLALDYITAEVERHGIHVESVDFAEDAEVRAVKLLQNDCRIWGADKTPGEW